MGFVFSYFWTKKEFNILLIGLLSAGKATIFQKLNNLPLIPGISFSTENFNYKSLKIHRCVINEDKNCRKILKLYYQFTDGIIFVLDSYDKINIEEALSELNQILDEEELRNCPILVLANKQDLIGALSPDEITEKMQMNKYIGRKFLVKGTSAMTGEGLKEGLDWMDSVLNN